MVDFDGVTVRISSRDGTKVWTATFELEKREAEGHDPPKLDLVQAEKKCKPCGGTGEIKGVGFTGVIPYFVCRDCNGTGLEAPKR